MPLNFRKSSLAGSYISFQYFCPTNKIQFYVKEVFIFPETRHLATYNNKAVDTPLPKLPLAYQ